MKTSVWCFIRASSYLNVCEPVVTANTELRGVQMTSQTAGGHRKIGIKSD